MKIPFIVVADDLKYLRETWTSKSRDEQLREGSATLRRLLIYGDIQKAWDYVKLDGKPIIHAPDLRGLIGNKIENVDVAFAGFGNTKIPPSIAGNVMIAGFQRRSGDDDPAPPSREEFEKNLNKAWKLREFTESVCAVVGGTPVRRIDVIKFFAHVMGGAHLALSEKELERNKDLIAKLEPIFERVQLAGKDALYRELLITGQLLAHAKHMKILERRIRDLESQ